MRLIFVSLSSLLTLLLNAQSPTFVASTNAKQVATQGVFEVTFTLENARGTNFQSPDFNCFDFRSGPSQSMSTSIINGAMTQSMSFTYTLMRTRPGTCTIGPATIQVGSKTYTTEPLTVEIVEGEVRGQERPPGAEDVFLKAEITDKPVYPGQQVRLDYKVYTAVNVRNYNILSEDDYDQFYYRYIQDFNNRARLEVIDGVQYTVRTIKSLALFPQQTGRFGIAPMVAQLGLTVRNERPSFLFGSRTVGVNVATDSIFLNVQPLPAGAPESFTGAVGAYRMNATISKQQVTTDDAVVLTLDIIGSGDPKRWSPPDLSALKSEYELYDPRILLDESMDQGGEIRHRRTIEYLLIPRAPGNKTLQVDFTYFDPDSAVYRTISSSPFPLVIAKGTRTSPGEHVFSADAASMQLRGLKPYQHGSTGVFLFTPFYFILLFLPILGLGVVFWIRRRQDLYDALDPAEKRRRKARRIAEKYLHEAAQHVSGTDKLFYDSLSRAIFTFISAKLNLRPSDLSKSNILEQLQKLSIPTDLRDETMQILNTSEQVLYAGGTSHADRQKIYQRTLELIGAVEEKIEVKE